MLRLLSLEGEIVTATRTVLLTRTGQNCLKCRNDRRVELTLHGLREPEPRNTARHRVAIWAIRCHRVIGIRHGDDSCKEWYFVVGETVRISQTIDPFVVVTHNTGDLGVVLNLGQDPFANRGMLFHLPSLLEGKSAWLLQQSGRETNFADVVNEATKVDKLLFFGGETEPDRDVAGIDRDGSRMTSRVTVSRIQSSHESARERQARAL